MNITGEKILIVLLAILLGVSAVGYFQKNAENKRLRKSYESTLEKERRKLRYEIDSIRSDKDSIAFQARLKDIRYDSLMSVMNEIDTTIREREIIYIERIKEIDSSTPKEIEEYWRTEFDF